MSAFCSGWLNVSRTLGDWLRCFFLDWEGGNFYIPKSSIDREAFPWWHHIWFVNNNKKKKEKRKKSPGILWHQGIQNAFLKVRSIERRFGCLGTNEFFGSRWSSQKKGNVGQRNYVLPFIEPAVEGRGRSFLTEGKLEWPLFSCDEGSVGRRWLGKKGCCAVGGVPQEREGRSASSRWRRTWLRDLRRRSAARPRSTSIPRLRGRTTFGRTPCTPARSSRGSHAPFLANRSSNQSESWFYAHKKKTHTHKRKTNVIDDDNSSWEKRILRFGFSMFIGWHVLELIKKKMGTHFAKKGGSIGEQSQSLAP